MADDPGEEFKALGAEGSREGEEQSQPRPAVIHGGSERRDSSEDRALALAFYEAARAEILQRLTMRETTFLAWITTASLIVGWTTQELPSNPSRTPILELVPVLALAFGIALYRHTMIIRMLGEHIRKELNPYLDQSTNPYIASLRHWDNSEILEDRVRAYLVSELAAFMLFMVGIPLACVMYLITKEHLPWYKAALLPGELSTAILLAVGAIELNRTGCRQR